VGNHAAVIEIFIRGGIVGKLIAKADLKNSRDKNIPDTIRKA
jgi:hypothetical protein